MKGVLIGRLICLGIPRPLPIGNSQQRLVKLVEQRLVKMVEQRLVKLVEQRLVKMVEQLPY